VVGVVVGVGVAVAVGVAVGVGVVVGVGVGIGVVVGVAVGVGIGVVVAVAVGVAVAVEVVVSAFHYYTNNNKQGRMEMDDINFDSLTIARARELIPQMRELLGMFGETTVSHGNELPFPVGTAVYVRGAIYSTTGRIKERRGEWLILTEASYVGTDGRFSEASQRGLQNAKDSEIEPVGGERVIAVNVGATSDVTIHPCELPHEVK
jgi:hypothetical protein